MKDIWKRLAAGLLAFVLLAALVPDLTAPVAAAEEEKQVALTFDDGPGPYTEALLDALLERDVRATFFVQGWRLEASEAYYDLLVREVEEGHQIGNHGYDHPTLTQCTEEEILSQLQRCNNFLVMAGGEQVYAMRPPHGTYNSTVQSLVSGPIILWSLDPLDWQYHDKDRAVNYVVSNVKNGDIILLHDTVETSVDAAIEIVDELQAQGYEFVTVEELMARRGIELEAGEVYRNGWLPLLPFSDVKEGSWYYNVVRAVCDRGLFSGIGNDLFGPDNTMTRGMFCTVLGAYIGHGQMDTETPFSDVSTSAYYARHVLWAWQNGIVAGYGGGKFGPDDPITREQAAVMMMRVLSYLELLPDPAGQSALPYLDADAISGWAAKAISVCTDLGFFTGDPDGSFNPQRQITRAEAAAVFLALARYADGVLGG